jgi:GR25 family glycosyltransferase involved in LPS biosynthesis
MKSYMITYSGDEKRKANFLNVKQFSLKSLEKFEAIDSINYYEYWKDRAISENLCSTKYTSNETDKYPGKLGCNLSYLYLFQHICSNTDDSEWVLIIEDDCTVETDTEPYLHNLISQLEALPSGLNVEYINLYSDPEKIDLQFSGKYHVKKDLYKMIPQYYTSAQLIKVSGMKKILNCCPIDENIDFWRNENREMLSCLIWKNSFFKNRGSMNRHTHQSSKNNSMGSLIWDSANIPPKQILFQMHIMWYESKMINETLDSLQKAIDKSKVPVKVVLGLNSQTYLEEPQTGNPQDMFECFSSHPILSQEYTDIYLITNKQDFYNIGDWRREVYNPNALYTVWGESDCLIPSDYFNILYSTASQIPYAHFMTLASRKMWDSTWDLVEHPEIRSYPRGKNRENIKELYGSVPSHLASEQPITYEELESFNKRFQPEVKKLNFHKVDGSLLAISKNFPTPFIGEKVRFAREDTCFENFCRIKDIPQFLIETKIKGHNYKHPLKRLNTQASRSDNIYKSYESESINQINLFLKSLSQTPDNKRLKKYNHNVAQSTP